MEDRHTVVASLRLLSPAGLPLPDDGVQRSLAAVYGEPRPATPYAISIVRFGTHCGFIQTVPWPAGALPCSAVHRSLVWLTSAVPWHCEIHDGSSQVQNLDQKAAALVQL